MKNQRMQDAHKLPRRLLRPNEAAATLAISARLLWTLTNTGQIPCVRINRAIRYDPVDLDAWIERQKSRPGCGENALTSGAAVALVDTNTAAKPAAA